MLTLRFFAPAHLALAVSVFAGGIAACGGGGGTDTPPATPNFDPSTGPSGSVSTPTPPSTGSSTPMPPSTGTPPMGLAMKPIAPSTMAADLTALGLDPKKLPALSAMKPDQLRQLMKTFSKSTGMACTGCHDQNNFALPTPNKKVAAKMWDNYTRGMTFEDGSLVYCDSCHQGKAEFLDDHDKKALGKWMDDNFVSKLKRVDKKENGCTSSSCHGDAMDMHFLEKWKK